MTGPAANAKDDLTAGLHPVPPGHLAAVVTHLDMRAPPRTLAVPARDDLRLVPLDRTDTGAYRALFAAVGTDWLWFSRLRLPSGDLAAILADPAVLPLAALRGGQPVGLLELDFRAAPVAELAFFGLVAEAAGQGLGRWLMGEALARAWDPTRGITRLTVHTCTLDSPAALPFYLKSGFTPLRREVEIAPDPRLDGTLPEDAAPQVPVIR